MDFSTAFRFFTEDATWKRKFGVAALLTGIPAVISALYTYFMDPSVAPPDMIPSNLLPIAGLLALPLLIFASCVASGYSIDISRNVRDGEKHPLPEWSFGSQFKQGLTISIAAIIYVIPFSIILGILMAVVLIPMIIGGTAPEWTMIVPTVISSVLFFSLLAFFMSALQINYIRHNTFDSCFHFKSIKFILKNRWKKLLQIMLVGGAVSLVVGGIPLGLGLASPLSQLVSSALFGLTVTPLLTFVYGHLYGQVASLVDLDKLNAVDPVG